MRMEVRSIEVEALDEDEGKHFTEDDEGQADRQVCMDVMYTAGRACIYLAHKTWQLPRAFSAEPQVCCTDKQGWFTAGSDGSGSMDLAYVYTHPPAARSTPGAGPAPAPALTAPLSLPASISTSAS